MAPPHNAAMPAISERSVHRAVTLRYGASLSGVAALCIMGWILLSTQLAQHSAMDAIISRAGAQRMLSHQIAGLVAERLSAEDQALRDRAWAQATAAEAKYLSVYKDLTQGAAGEAPPGLMTPELRAAYFSGPDPVAAATQRIKDGLSTIESGHMSREQAYALIAWMRGPLITVLDRAVAAHRQAANRTLSRLELFQASEFAAVLLLLLLEAFLVFRPLARSLARQTTELLRQSAALRERTEEMQRLASTDWLTQLANRHALTAALARPAEATGVISFDLDCFKYVNDTYGHGAGDAVLRAVGERLRSVCRSSDLIVRMGGDEFTVVLFDLPSIDFVFMIAERIRLAVEAPVLFEGKQLSVGASIGTCIMPDEAGTLEQALKLADHAQRAAKQRSKARGLAWRPTLVKMDG